MATPLYPLAGRPAAAALAPTEVEYPESDGEPMAETSVHVHQIVYLVVALENFLAGDPQVFVGANLFLYYVEGDPDQRVAPDVFVVRGVPGGERRRYRVWDEGRAPDVVFEITSESSKEVDAGPKRAVYQRLGVPEYFLFDPLGEYLRPRLQGYRLQDGVYRWLPPAADGSLASEQLGLALHVREGRLRLYDPQQGRWLLAPAEEFAARLAAEVRAREAEARWAEEAAARRALEAELARLRAELARREA